MTTLPPETKPPNSKPFTSAPRPKVPLLNLEFRLELAVRQVKAHCLALRRVWRETVPRLRATGPGRIPSRTRAPGPIYRALARRRIRSRGLFALAPVQRGRVRGFPPVRETWPV